MRAVHGHDARLEFLEWQNPDFVTRNPGQGLAIPNGLSHVQDAFRMVPAPRAAACNPGFPLDAQREIDESTACNPGAAASTKLLRTPVPPFPCSLTPCIPSSRSSIDRREATMVLDSRALRIGHISCLTR